MEQRLCLCRHPEDVILGHQEALTRVLHQQGGEITSPAEWFARISYEKAVIHQHTAGSSPPHPQDSAPLYREELHLCFL
jgi:hypothetical protein